MNIELLKTQQTYEQKFRKIMSDEYNETHLVIKYYSGNEMRVTLSVYAFNNEKGDKLITIESAFIDVYSLKDDEYLAKVIRALYSNALKAVISYYNYQEK